MLINKNSKVLCVLPKYAYGVKEREYSAEYQSFYYSLRNNFKNFFFFNSILTSSFLGFIINLLLFRINHASRFLGRLFGSLFYYKNIS